MLLSAEQVLIAGERRVDVVIDIDDHGRIAAVGDVRSLGAPERQLAGLLIPGLVDAHVNLLARAQPSSPDGFLANRHGAYKMATTLDATALRAIARYHFVEMLRVGITSVGAVLTVHHRPDGSSYRDPSTMADALALAARDAGIRMCLLRSVRLRGDFQRGAEGPERRECDPSIDVATERVTFTTRRLAGYADGRLSCGVAVESLATVPPDALIALKTRLAHLPLHVGAAMALAEAITCQTLYGLSPIELLVRAGIVDGCTALVGVTSARPDEIELLACCGGVVVRLGGRDTAGVTATLESAGVTVALPAAQPRADAGWLDRVTVAGGRALAQRTGRVAPGYWADLVTLDLEELADVPLGAGPLPVRDVIVGGEAVVADGEHPGAASAARGYTNVARLL